MSIARAAGYAKLLATPTGGASIANLRKGYRAVPSSDPALLLPETVSVQFADQFKSSGDFLDVSAWDAKHIWSNDLSAPNLGAAAADPTLVLGLIATVLVASAIFGRHDLSSTSFSHQPNFAEFSADDEDISGILAEDRDVKKTVPHGADRLSSIKKVRWSL
eukprot:TRINITY_DN2149_c0_g1_i1.p1 TRINITY_DN2149_c0_g1~~TRINITY_DN2149_c0_g1_i1.p1  ORF type:complete len:175 (-),score=42.05 TRINITY_DN2149_c0_g1_i1:145-630(-)